MSGDNVRQQKHQSNKTVLYKEPTRAEQNKIVPKSAGCDLNSVKRTIYLNHELICLYFHHQIVSYLAAHRFRITHNHKNFE